ncbi:MAG: plastocyanin/azurin family copper-binding protein, partial [Gammaproteobacteria bacterium]
PSITPCWNTSFPNSKMGGVEAVMASADVAAVVDLNNRLKFVPSEIRVKVGDTVEWRNIQSYAHTVTADPNRAARKANIELPDGVRPFDSGRLGAGATFRYTFTRPGIYRYVCLPHENSGMLGTVVVE